MHDSECFLHYVFRIVAVSQQLRGEQCGGTNVAPYQYAKRGAIAARGGSEERRIGPFVIAHASRDTDALPSNGHSAFLCRRNVNSSRSHVIFPLSSAIAADVAGMTADALQGTPPTAWVHVSLSPARLRSFAAPSRSA